MSASSLRRDPTSGLTVKVMARKGPPDAESVTAALAARSLQFLRKFDPVFDVDMYRSLGDELPDGVAVEQALALNGGQVLTPQTVTSLEAAMIESRKSPDAAGGIYPLSFGHQLRLFTDDGNRRTPPPTPRPSCPPDADAPDVLYSLAPPLSTMVFAPRYLRSSLRPAAQLYQCDTASDEDEPHDHHPGQLFAEDRRSQKRC